MKAGSRASTAFLVGLVLTLLAAPGAFAQELELGREVSVARHLEDGEELEVPLSELIEHGQLLFDAVWTDQEGGGRPLTGGTGAELANPDNPLVFPRNFNRVSAPDANSCAGCHNAPRSGGGGDIVTNVFVLGQRFDHITFDGDDPLPLSSSHDENGNPVTLDGAANSRATVGMFGSGYIEMLARQITEDLQAIVAATRPGETRALQSTGISFGTIGRQVDGTWDVSGVEGLPPASTASEGADDPPSMIIRPFHQVGAVVSLRQFTNNAYNHHHGMQPSERFGLDTDPDGDGFTNELTRADVTAVAVYQATLPAPGRRIPRHRELEEAVLLGEQKFEAIGCAGCHVPRLPLRRSSAVYREPNPFNPPGNLQVGEAPPVAFHLNDRRLPPPRLQEDENGIVWVPAFTDFKLHDITAGPDDPNRERINQHHVPGSEDFLLGNGYFLTKKLWGVANEPPYFHHGKFTTMRAAIEAHAGEAQAAADAWRALSDHERNSIIEFLKTLQVLPAGTRSLVVDEKGNPRSWPPPWARPSPAPPFTR